MSPASPPPGARARALAAAAALAVALPAAAIEFRTLDGHGNNPANPDWGAAHETLVRLTPNAYEDWKSVPRGGLAPGALPSARAISNAVAAQSGRIDNRHGASDWLWQWGQFLDHDLDLSDPASPAEPFDIPVPTNDATFDPFDTGTQSIRLNRTIYTTDSAGVRQQVNEITAYIDASNIYGSDAARAAFLRGPDGTLRMQRGANGEGLLLFNDGLPNAGSGASLFISGDVRANEQIGLTATHTLFNREHNRLAGELGRRLDGGEAALVDRFDASGLSRADFIYEAARRVVGAQMQKITYTEFLPLLTGVDLTAAYGGYDSSVNAGVANEFSGAAYRLGHTMLSPSLLRFDPFAATPTTTIALRDAFFNPDEVFEHGVDSLLAGLGRRRAQAIDTRLVDDVRNFLFGPLGAGGFDLAALNIQRGRDHGIGGLNAVRSALGLAPYLDFDALTGGDELLAAAFASVYGSVEEVDLWIGGLAETAAAQSMLGETLTHIVLDQFTRSMLGDRFFYLAERELIDMLDPSFADATLGSIIRRNTRMKGLPDNVFLASLRYVPEPSSLLLGLAGAGVMLAQARRRPVASA
ncbi:MAG: peroxidase family protein [Gammaproteobacteria bacterium]